MSTDLSSYNNQWYNPGSPVKRKIWHYTNQIFFRSGYFPFYGLKRTLLRLFGARIGTGVLVKPSVNIKYPWFLSIGNYVWIGEGVWIDNTANVQIGNHVCISQGALLLTGNHNYKRPSFDLVLGDIILEDGVWIGARAVIGPGVTCKSHSILSVGAVATKDLDAWFIYSGNPAVKGRERIFENTNH